MYVDIFSLPHKDLCVRVKTGYLSFCLFSQNALYETQQAHAAQLTNLRLPHRTLRLKPMQEANNPILAKRRQQRYAFTV